MTGMMTSNDDEDREDRDAVRAFDAAMARGEEELIPAAFVNRILDGENKVRVWREFRGMTVEALAEAAGVSATALYKIEAGDQQPDTETLSRLAAALRLDVEDIEVTTRDES